MQTLSTTACNPTSHAIINNDYSHLKLHSAPPPALGTPPQSIDTLFQEKNIPAVSKDQSITDKIHFSDRCIPCPEYYGVVDRSTYSPVPKIDDPAGVFCLSCRTGAIHGETTGSRPTEILRNPTSITTLPSIFSVPNRLSVVFSTDAY